MTDMERKDPPAGGGADDAFPDDWDAPPSAEELAAAESLRAALEGEKPPASAEAELAESVRNAARPGELAKDRHEAIVQGALRKAPRKGRVIVVAFGATVLAAAAGFAIVVGSLSMRREAAAPSAAAPAGLVPRRSTAELFAEPFPREGGTSERVDRIASARAHDLRENRFARWGVR